MRYILIGCARCIPRCAAEHARTLAFYAFLRDVEWSGRVFYAPRATLSALWSAAHVHSNSFYASRAALSAVRSPAHVRPNSFYASRASVSAARSAAHVHSNSLYAFRAALSAAHARSN